MIEWGRVFSASVWISGLALCLAVLSMASYDARVGRVRIGQLLGMPTVLCALSAGMGLFCVGLALGQMALWLRLLLGLLAALFAVQAILSWRQSRKSRPPSAGLKR
jgi:hypothetical protein